MARCDYPITVVKAGEKTKKGKVFKEPVRVGCGHCYNCRINKMRGWIFRLQQEYEVCNSAHFVTLTYEDQHLPISENGKASLLKSDVQDFFKKLRHTQKMKITYYLVGEYGTRFKRPHYHIILFNVLDQENIFKKWNKGTVHVGTVTKQSISYTLEYMSKRSDVKKVLRNDTWVMEDTRLKEFSLYSKGIGSTYVTEETIAYHKRNLKNMYINTYDNSKVSMPRFYRNLLFTEEEKMAQTKIVQKETKKLDVEIDRKYTSREQDSQKGSRWDRLNNSSSKS